MAVLSTVSRHAYTGRSDTGPYAIPFPVSVDEFGDALDVRVWVLDTLGVVTDITSTCVVDGLNVYTPAPYPATYQVVLTRDPEPTQPDEWDQGGKFPASRFEGTLDRIVFIAQSILRRVPLLRSPADDPSLDTTMPRDSERAGRFLAFDTSGRPIASAGTPGTVPVSAFMETVLDDVDAAAAKATLGVDTDLADLAGAGRTTETVKGNADDLADLAGVGRTVETVKGNADALTLAVPPGVIWPYGGASAPPGFLLCDGAEVGRSVYPGLYSAIGDTFLGSGLITNGNCEDTVYPHYENPSVHRYGCTYARSSTYARSRQHSFVLTKTSAYGASAFAAINGPLGATNLCGFLPGHTYKLSVWVYIPTQSPSLPANRTSLSLQCYNGGAWTTVQAYGSILDSWEFLTVTVTIPSTATGAHARWNIISNTVNPGAVAYLDDWVLQDLSMFFLPDPRGISLTGVGSQVIDGRTKTGPALGEAREDQFQGFKATLRTWIGGADDDATKRRQGATNAANNERVDDDTAIMHIGFGDDGVNGTPRTGPYTHGPELGVNFIIKT